jgi:hypothetical protein
MNAQVFLGEAPRAIGIPQVGLPTRWVLPQDAVFAAAGVVDGEIENPIISPLSLMPLIYVSVAPG